MARGTGTANLAASLEVLAGAPLDARTVVPTVADLTTAANFPYKYIGLPVVVQATGDLYILTGSDVTDPANWKKVGDGGSSGGSDNVVEGYYNSLDYLFYEEVTYDTPIAGASEVIYVAVDTDKTYRYDGQIFVRLDEERDTGSDNVVEGYYNTEDQLFYEESTYTTAISGESEVIYVALDTNKTYRYNGSIFVRLDEESGGGDGGHTIVNESGTEMTQEDKLQFTSGLKVTDDSENATTKVEADLMAAADMDEIIPELPGVMSRLPKYSTSEQVVGEWIDGKPIYQQTVVLPAKITLSANTWLVTAVSSATKEQIISVVGHRTVEHGGLYAPLIGNTNGGNGLEIKSGATCELEMITVQYTKTTD